MPLKPCLDCGTLSSQPRCATHRAAQQRARDQRRGTTTQRGYGAPHQAERATWEPAVKAGTVTCRRCKQPINPDDPWDLGHPDAECPAPKGPEHANRCNRAAGGRAAHRA